jgi:hypothetical protein
MALPAMPWRLSPATEPLVLLLLTFKEDVINTSMGFGLGG